MITFKYEGGGGSSSSSSSSEVVVVVELSIWSSNSASLNSSSSSSSSSSGGVHYAKTGTVVQYQLATTSSDSSFLVDTAPSKLYSAERLRLWPNR